MPYADGTMVVATLNGELFSVTGRLARDPLIAGNIEIARAIAAREPGRRGGGDRREAYRPVGGGDGDAQSAHRPMRGTPVPTSRPSVVRLDINVNAPRRIFVRGRGLDAELGGSFRLTGPVTDIQPVGAFQLIRGRLSILGQRIASMRAP